MLISSDEGDSIPNADQAQAQCCRSLMLPPPQE
jgi:hypothetical protein